MVIWRRVAKRTMRQPQYKALQARYMDTLSQRDRCVRELEANSATIERLQSDLKVAHEHISELTSKNAAVVEENKTF